MDSIFFERVGECCAYSSSALRGSLYICPITARRAALRPALSQQPPSRYNHCLVSISGFLKSNPDLTNSRTPSIVANTTPRQGMCVLLCSSDIHRCGLGWVCGGAGQGRERQNGRRRLLKPRVPQVHAGITIPLSSGCGDLRVRVNTFLAATVQQHG